MHSRNTGPGIYTIYFLREVSRSILSDRHRRTYPQTYVWGAQNIIHLLVVTGAGDNQFVDIF